MGHLVVHMPVKEVSVGREAPLWLHWPKRASGDGLSG
jgi:hypothetical protein